MAGVPSDWLNFSTRTFTKDSRNEFRKRYCELLRKEIEGPEVLDYAEFSTLHDGLALQNFDQFCHVSYRHENRIFTSQAWNRLFRIQEQVVMEYVMEFLFSFTFRDHVVELDIANTMETLLLNVANEDEAAAVEARGAQSEEGGVRRHPNMTFTNKLRAMDDRLEFGQMRMEQERFHNWNTDHLSQLLAHHHIDHTRYDGTRYSYVLNVPDLGVHQGVNYMSSPQIFSNAPTASPNLFGLFDVGAGPSTTPNQGNDMDEE
ncbi:hypothetical protein Tco_1056598 [Tanacetum coccineum]|uniref:Uncharacterized protein n=1 Tax=Tanacetum coccineum TaxID=301880 RepID=A0ABQ5H422_9ASTR